MHVISTFFSSLTLLFSQTTKGNLVYLAFRFVPYLSKRALKLF